MRAQTRRGLLVVLDLVNSTRALVVPELGGAGRHPVIPAGDGRERAASSLDWLISNLSYLLWEAGGETTAFTGDGLLVFFEDRGRPRRVAWALIEALQDCGALLADHAYALGPGSPPLGLRGAVHYADALEVLDGPLAGRLIGRSTHMVEEAMESVRHLDWRPGMAVNVAVTRDAAMTCQIPLGPVPVMPAKSCRVFSARDPLGVLDYAPLGRARPCSPARRRGIYARHSGMVVYIGWQASLDGPAFPNLTVYLDAMWRLVDLACLCDLDVVGVTPTGVLGFVAKPQRVRDDLEWLLECLCGQKLGQRNAPEAVRRIRQLGWDGVRLVAGIVHGPVARPLTGPLTGQGLGAGVICATRFAQWVTAMEQAGKSLVAIATPREFCRDAPQLLAPRSWRELCGHLGQKGGVPAPTGSRCRSLPIAEGESKNLPDMGYRSAWVLTRRAGS
ncbi:MAG: hypothetical protein JXR77_17155 [Lentisphaeria bacterium]|nr:hypothetical protein [Lentisphaeria bacterium]